MTLRERVSNFFAPKAQEYAAPTGREISWAQSWLTGQIASYNPDSLVTKKGIGIYKKMASDEQVKACLCANQYAVLSSGWDIKEPVYKKPVGSVRTAQGKMHTAFIKFNFAEMEGTLESRLLDIMSSQQYGYSISEVILDRLEYGRFKGLIGLKALKTRDPEGWEFLSDDFGNLTGLLQGNRPMPPSRFIVRTHRKQFGNFYGESDLRTGYRAWFIKDAVLKFLTMTLERHGMPIPVFTVNAQLSADSRTALENFIKGMQAKTGLILPSGVALDMKEPQAKAAEAFIPVIQMLDQAIRISMLMPGLLGFSAEHEVGSMARAVKEYDSFLWVLGQIRSDLETIITDKLIKPLIDVNYEVSDGLYPAFKFNEVDAESKQAQFENWLKAVQAGAFAKTFDDENAARALIGLRQLEQSEWDEAQSKKPAPQGRH